MFPKLEAATGSTDAIKALIKLMVGRQRESHQNRHIPAGFTYVGQFIDHDITFDPTPLLDQVNDPDALVNFRTPRFDLDSVYGSGPEVQPYLYDWNERKPFGTRLLVGRNTEDPALAAEPARAKLDLPRNQQGRALIGDPRNDENVIVAQLHLLFIRFHNAVLDHLIGGGEVKEPELFEAARRIVRWHYQWVVIHEFLPKVVGEKTASEVLRPGADGTPPAVRLKYFELQSGPFIPFEFSGAVYRFGHSMVRADYGLKRGSRPEPLVPNLEGLTWLPERLVIDWERFFDLPGAEEKPLPSMRIDTGIVGPLWKLSDGNKELPKLNLLRGEKLELPSGQEVARAMNGNELSEDELRLDSEVLGDARKTLLESTPLWYYILCEAAAVKDANGLGGPHLGPVGGRIVAEVLVGLLQSDPSSYLNEEPGWRPFLGPGDDFSMADLIEFAERP